MTTPSSAVLSYFNDLLRAGVVGLGEIPRPGKRLGQWPNGLCHITRAGEATLAQASRDPINQAGYLAYLDQEAKLDGVTKGYIEEALNTYRTCCYKATAVMIGAAVENLVMNLRDELQHRLAATDAKVPKGLTEWAAKKVLEAIADKILPDLAADGRKSGDEAIRNLSEEAEARLRPAAAEFRKTRNDAGHPASLTPVNPADVHCNLLLFPSTAKLLQRLSRWVGDYYK